MWALATLWQAYGHVGARDAVERTVMDQRWQMVLDGLGAEPPPCSQGRRCNCRKRLMTHDVAQVLWEWTVALAEQTGGVGARPWRAALDSTPWCGAGRVEDPLNRLGHALRKAVGLAAAELGRSAAALREAADLVLVGHSRFKAALARDWGAPTARVRAWCLVRQEIMATMAQMSAQDTAPDPDGSPGGRRRRAWRTTAASRLQTKPGGMAASAAPNRSMAFRSTGASIWTASSPGRSWCVRPTSPSLRWGASGGGVGGQSRPAAAGPRLERPGESSDGPVGGARRAHYGAPLVPRRSPLHHKRLSSGLCAWEGRLSGWRDSASGPREDRRVSDECR